MEKVQESQKMKELDASLLLQLRITTFRKLCKKYLINLERG